MLKVTTSVSTVTGVLKVVKEIWAVEKLPEWAVATIATGIPWYSIFKHVTSKDIALLGRVYKTAKQCKYWSNSNIFITCQIMLCFVCTLQALHVLGFATQHTCRLYIQMETTIQSFICAWDCDNFCSEEPQTHWEPLQAVTQTTEIFHTPQVCTWAFYFRLNCFRTRPATLVSEWWSWEPQILESCTYSIFWTNLTQIMTHCVRRSGPVCLAMLTEKDWTLLVSSSGLVRGLMIYSNMCESSVVWYTADGNVPTFMPFKNWKLCVK